MAEDTIRILLIEDNPGDTNLIRRMLNSPNSHAFDLRHAGNLQSGLKSLKKAPTDVLLLDLGLPGTEGFEAIAMVTAAAPHLPIIVLTGTDEAQTVLECIKAGAKDYFVKSRIDREALIAAIRRVARYSGGIPPARA